MHSALWAAGAVQGGQQRGCGYEGQWLLLAAPWPGEPSTARHGCSQGSTRTRRWLKALLPIGTERFPPFPSLLLLRQVPLKAPGTALALQPSCWMGAPSSAAEITGRPCCGLGTGWEIPAGTELPSQRGPYLAEPHGDEAIAGSHPEQPGVLVVLMSWDALQGTQQTSHQHCHCPHRAGPCCVHSYSVTVSNCGAECTGQSFSPPRGAQSASGVGMASMLGLSLWGHLGGVDMVTGASGEWKQGM